MAEGHRLAILMPSKGWGGIERNNVNLINEFLRLGHEVDLVLSRDAVLPYPDKLSSECRVVDLKAKHKATAVPRFLSYLRDRRPAIVITAKDHGAKVGLATHSLGPSGIKLMVVVQNCYDITVKARRRRLVIRMTYPRADSIVFASRGALDSFLKICQPPEEKLHVIHNPILEPGILLQAEEPVDHPWFQTDATAGPVIISAGRLEEQKDYPTLIRAFARVRSERPCRLVIVGEGSLRAPLEALCAELDVADDVSLPGFTPNPYAFVARADLFVMSSAWEGFGNVLAEALAVGTPVVSTDCRSGPREILEDGKHGPLVPVGDDRALAEAIAETLDNPSSADDLKRVAQRFDVRSIARQYLQVAGLA
jgi:glycosyltransferase involved in cell wall biosynthesis